VAELAREVPPPARERLAQISELLNQVEEQLRRLAHELRPTVLDDLGLVPALRLLVEGISARTGLPVAIEGAIEGHLPPQIATALYRSVQEALTNVTKHAQASRAKVELRRDSRSIRCVISDDGVGFDVPGMLRRQGERGLGLIGIQERLDPFHAVLDIKSAPGRGTELVIKVPLES
jgi:signal transduction histidine kinase